MKSGITKGTIFKNRRHHPDKVFMVVRVVGVKKGEISTHKIYGLQAGDGAEPITTSYIFSDFVHEFPFVYWSPNHG